MFVRKRPRVDASKAPEAPEPSLSSAPIEPAPRPSPEDRRRESPPTVGNKPPAVQRVPKVPVPAPRPKAPMVPAPKMSTANEPTAGRLVIGKSLHLTGEIRECDEIVVDGTVRVTLEARHLKVLEDGDLAGDCTVESAEIYGLFEGNLVVREKLAIRSGGQVQGKIRYGSLEIGAGGILKGDVNVRAADAAPDAETAPETPESSAVATIVRS